MNSTATVLIRLNGKRKWPVGAAEMMNANAIPTGTVMSKWQITQQYTSGKVRTRGLADWKYGRFEARIKLPTGQGTWPAFWMLPADDVYGGWPLSGEIDIMETVNLGAACSVCEGSAIENRSSGTLHFGSAFPKKPQRAF